MDELSKLEEKLDRLISLISELKHKVEDFEEKNNVLHLESMSDLNGFAMCGLSHFNAVHLCNPYCT